MTICNNSVINDAVLESWRGAWGTPLGNGRFSNTRNITYKIIDGYYHVFTDKIAAYQTDRFGNPAWMPLQEYNSIKFTSHHSMTAPDMELDEIHAAQALMEGS